MFDAITAGVAVLDEISGVGVGVLGGITLPGLAGGGVFGETARGGVLDGITCCTRGAAAVVIGVMVARGVAVWLLGASWFVRAIARAETLIHKDPARARGLRSITRAMPIRATTT